MMHTSPIGILDSGLGGLSVWQEIVKQLPQESIIYYADQLHCPYGDKSAQEVLQLSRKATEFLQQKNCKLIVVACNSATGVAIEELRKSYRLPFVGIEPAIKPASLNTQTKKVGILATQRTLEGKLFQNTKAKYAQGIEVIEAIGKGLVELVENEAFDSPQAERQLRAYIEPMLEQNIDQLILGCTHYPFLLNLIEKIVEDQAVILNPAAAVARQVQRVLSEHQLINQISPISIYHFYSTAEISPLKNFVEHITENTLSYAHYSSLATSIKA